MAIDIIYKLRNWECDRHREMFINNQIFLASPSSFNDPFDCKVPRNWYLLPVEEEDDYIAKRIEVGIASGKILPQEALHYFNNIKLRMSDRQSFQREEETMVFKSVDDHYGVFSATIKWDNLLMWSHYAKEHKGFAIGFNYVNLIEYLATKFRGIKSDLVKYKKDFPQINPKADLSESEAFEFVFIRTHTKFLDWKYEKEYRVLVIEPNRSLTDHARNVEVPQGCVTEVILGLEISDCHKSDIIDVCVAKNIPVYRTYKVPFKFAIAKDRIF